MAVTLKTVLAGLALAAAALAPAGAADEKSFLFAETAEAASMADGVLTLSGVDQEMVWFSDRPFREAGTLTLAAFVDHWGDSADSFADDPPNAALTGIVGEDQRTVILELLEPELSGSDLRFHYDVIEGEEFEIMEGVALLIDGFGLCCW